MTFKVLALVVEQFWHVYDTIVEFNVDSKAEYSA